MNVQTINQKPTIEAVKGGKISITKDTFENYEFFNVHSNVDKERIVKKHNGSNLALWALGVAIFGDRQKAAYYADKIKRGEY